MTIQFAQMADAFTTELENSQGQVLTNLAVKNSIGNTTLSFGTGTENKGYGKKNNQGPEL
jgi:hypothetical protein